MTGVNSVHHVQFYLCFHDVKAGINPGLEWALLDYFMTNFRRRELRPGLHAIYVAIIFLFYFPWGTW
jgi:hypothetical protein